MNNIVLSIFYLTVSGSAVAILLILLKQIFKKKISQAFFYYVWILVLLRFIVPISSPISFLGKPLDTLNQMMPISDTDNSDKTVSLLENEDELTIGGDSAEKIPADIYANSLTEKVPEIVEENSPPIPQKQVTSPPATKPASLNIFEFLESNLFGIWLSGVFIYLLRYAIPYLKFKRKITRTVEVADKADLDVFQRVCKKHNVSLLYSRHISIPVQVGILSPCIVLPNRKYVQDNLTQELEHILRHEYTHFRRKDLLYRWFMTIIFSFHWFNPLIYFFQREIINVGELACDEAVLKQLSDSQRLTYGETLLLFAAQNLKGSKILPNLLNHDKRILKERIQNIRFFQKRKIGASLLSILLLTAFVGCTAVLGPVSNRVDKAEQSVQEIAGETEEAFDDQNNIESVQDIHESTPPPTELIVFPETYTNEIKHENQALHVYFDAVVNAIPGSFYTVDAEPLILTQDVADRVMQVLIGDAELYPGESYRPPTEEEVLIEIVSLKEKLADPDYQNKLTQKNIQQRILYYENMLKTPLPIEKDFKKFEEMPPGITIMSDSELASYDKEEQALILEQIEYEINRDEINQEFARNYLIAGEIDLGKENQAHLFIIRDEEEPALSQILFSNYTAEEMSWTPGFFEEISVSQYAEYSGCEAAISLAKDTVSAMKIGNYKVSRVGYDKDRSGEIIYGVFLTPYFEGIPAHYAKQLGISPLNYHDEWQQEYIEIWVNKSGLINFEWISPTEVGSVIQENLSILPFSEICEIAEQQFVNTYANPTSSYIFLSEDILLSEIHITEIALGMRRMQTGNSGEYIYLPVWDFYGYTNNTYSEGSGRPVDENGKIVYKDFADSFLTLNALDGSLIEIYKERWLK